MLLSESIVNVAIAFLLYRQCFAVTTVINRVRGNIKAILQDSNVCGVKLGSEAGESEGWGLFLLTRHNTFGFSRCMSASLER
jgi:hypothetical protein